MTMNANFTTHGPRVMVRLLLAVSMLAAYLAFASPQANASAPFGIAKFTMQTTERTEEAVQGGFRHFVNVPYTFTQAGGHPWAMTTTLEFANEAIEVDTVEGGKRRSVVPTRDPKDAVVNLPLGLLGNPTAVPRCPLSRALGENARCPSATQIGVAVIHLLGEEKESVAPIVNLTPEAGQSAEFGVETSFNVTYLLTAHVVHTANGYGLAVMSNEIAISELYSVELTFWGVPADPSHDAMRGLICEKLEKIQTCGGGGVSSDESPVPFLTMPSDCAAGPETATIRADSWEAPGRYVEKTATMPGVTGCNALEFNPEIAVEPDTLQADAPVGLGVDLTVPQFETPDRLATPEMSRTVISFPEGMSISPGIVDGIQACNESGPEGINFTGSESEELGLNGEPQLAPGHCPDASIVGTAEAVTPLLNQPVKGHLYLARPDCGDAALGQRQCTPRDAQDGHLYQLYLELGGTGALADTGVNIKVRLKTEANPATGQLTAVAEEIAQLPFSELRVRLNGGPRAPLDNPTMCGRATTTADFTPWAAPGRTPEGVFMAGLGDATPSSFFEVEPHVTCPPSWPLTPEFMAGTVTANAGKFTSFTLNISRKDREQYMKGVQVYTPPGLLGVLASVPLCEEPQADAGACPQASKIGTARVASGAGSHPFEIEGSMYLTGPHDGAPFGLSIVTPAVAGPFNLGVVVVRARIDVDPSSGALTITTDETGPYAVPQIWYGIPLRLQRITVNVDRPNFMFNPTNCEAHHITASISGSQGAVANVASPFAVGGCRSLTFKPRFSVTTNGHTSRKRGASLDARLSYPKDAMGRMANVAYVKVSLPRQLPSFLETLQKACPAQTFASDPARCSKESIVGVARTSTPLLPVKLSGPVYFVSHGGEAFPQLIVVLQGDGVRVDLVGNTFISKGITSTTFKTVPDVPVSSFELYLPQGKNHALAANANLCKHRRQLVMPTEFVAQNGIVIRRETKIAVRGCRGRLGRRGHRKRAHGARASARSYSHSKQGRA